MGNGNEYGFTKEEIEAFQNEVFTDDRVDFMAEYLALRHQGAHKEAIKRVDDLDDISLQELAKFCFHAAMNGLSQADIAGKEPTFGTVVLKVFGRYVYRDKDLHFFDKIIENEPADKRAEFCKWIIHTTAKVLYVGEIKEQASAEN